MKGKEYKEEELPECGLIVSLESKKKEVEKFRRIDRRGRKLLMGIREKGMETEYRKIGEISGKNSIKKLFTKNMVIKINNKEEIEKIKQITDEKTLCHKYFIENKIK